MPAGKKFVDATKKYDRDALFTPLEALGMVKTFAPAKFDETVELAVQQVRGTARSMGIDVV